MDISIKVFHIYLTMRRKSNPIHAEESLAHISTSAHGKNKQP
jgi:hypothetical protein